jgi:HlyD family secretion protein
MKKRGLYILLISILIVAVAYWYFNESKNNTPDSNLEPSIQVTRGSIVSMALATGNIQPENEVQVKSKISGVVKRFFAEPGSFVQQGAPLLEVQPDPTPLELAEAKRNLELTGSILNNITTELQRAQTLKDRNLISQHDFDNIQQRFTDAQIRHQLNQERLELLESGKIKIGDSVIESVIRAPVSGYILERMVEIGDPIVPLTSFQAGTALMILADMGNLIFKGSVDEIDVGKISEGMTAKIKIGALPDAQIEGVLNFISLRSQRQDNATVFPVEIAITKAEGVILRAGYSANANIIIQNREDVLVIPERVVEYRNNGAYVEISDGENGGRKEIKIETGLSDAIMVEVLKGLNEGDTVLEKPIRRLNVEL